MDEHRTGSLSRLEVNIAPRSDSAAAYGLGLLFSIKTHRELFASAEHGEAGEAPWPIGLALATLAGVTLLVALVKRNICRVGATGR